MRHPGFAIARRVVHPSIKEVEIPGAIGIGRIDGTKNTGNLRDGASLASKGVSFFFLEFLRNEVTLDKRRCSCVRVSSDWTRTSFISVKGKNFGRRDLRGQTELLS